MITLIDYNAGNLTSVRLALETVGATANITAEPDAVRRAKRVIFPGVGAAQSAMDYLKQSALDEAIRDVVKIGVPFMGICLGMQILLDRSEEDDGTETLGQISGEVKKFMPDNRTIKVPEIGWNNVKIEQTHPIFDGIADESDFYFVHSYYPAPLNPDHWIGSTQYAAVRFASVIGRDNLIATQFHPEKSGKVGLKMIENFINWNP